MWYHVLYKVVAMKGEILVAFEKNGVKFNLDVDGVEDGDLYHIEAFNSGAVSSAELRKEYSRLREVANKRLQRMEGTRFEASQTYLKNAGKYTTIGQIEKEALANARNLKPEVAQKYVDSQIAKKTADLYKFLTAKTGSIRGMQKAENDLIESLRDKGFTWINKGNIQQFGEYMEYMRALHKGRQYDSERAAELFGTAVKKGINPEEISEDFEYWKEHDEELAKLPKIKSAQNRTAEAYRKLLERK